MKEKTQFYVFVIVITSMYMRVFKCTPGQTTKVFFCNRRKMEEKDVCTYNGCCNGTQSESRKKQRCDPGQAGGP